MFVLSCVIHNGDGLVMLFLCLHRTLQYKKRIDFMPKVRRKLMDKEPDKMELKLNDLSALYRVQPRRAVWSPLCLNTLEAFQKWNRFHRLTHKSAELYVPAAECPRVWTECSGTSFRGMFHLSTFTLSNNPFGVYHKAWTSYALLSLVSLTFCFPTNPPLAATLSGNV